MPKLKLESITRNEDGSYVLHVLVCDETKPDAVLTRLTTRTESLSEKHQAEAVVKIKEKLDKWREKEDKKESVKVTLQQKLDKLSP